ncbi:MAG: hypothetical protein HZC24_03100 [Rhodocyclales bacterium]|nr:hypothetical protein [Rhodocyclales bacterium]
MTVDSSSLPGASPVIRIDFDLGAVLEQYVGAFARQARAAGLTLSFDIGPDVPVVLIGDPQRLGQVLSHLVSNALKFTAAGEVTVAVRRAADAADGVRLHFAVTDTGSGLNAEQRGRLFAAAATSGLALCRSLVASLGGELGVESQPGIGSTLLFSARFEPRHAN